jgi:hypothetical protein
VADSALRVSDCMGVCPDNDSNPADPLSLEVIRTLAILSALPPSDRPTIRGSVVRIAETDDVLLFPNPFTGDYCREYATIEPDL